MPATTPEKPCVICGQECAGQPRIKDAQGRYAHRACAAKAESSAQQPAKPKPATPAGIDPIMANLLDDLPDPEKDACPSCGRVLRSQHIICTNCGYNRESGKAVRTQVQRAEKSSKARSESAGFEFTPANVAGIGLLATIALSVAAFSSVQMALPIVIIAFLWSGASTISMIYAAFVDGNPLAGILAFVPIGNLYFSLYYCTIGSERTTWKINYWMSGLASIVVLSAAWAGLFAGIMSGDISDEDASAFREVFQEQYSSLSDTRKNDMIMVAVADSILEEWTSQGAPIADRVADEIGILRTFDFYPNELKYSALVRWQSLTFQQRGEVIDAVFSSYPDFVTGGIPERIINPLLPNYTSISPWDLNPYMQTVLANRLFVEKVAAGEELSSGEEFLLMRGPAAMLELHSRDIQGKATKAFARLNDEEEQVLRDATFQMFPGYEMGSP